MDEAFLETKTRIYYFLFRIKGWNMMNMLKHWFNSTTGIDHEDTRKSSNKTDPVRSKVTINGRLHLVRLPCFPFLPRASK